MGFLQGPVGAINRLDPSASAPTPPRFAAVVPMATNGIDDGTARSVLTAAADAGAADIVVPVRGPPDAVDRVAEMTDSVPVDTRVLWCNGPRMTRLVESHGLELSGKGSDVWLALGPAAQAAPVVCCLDADASTTTPRSVARLVAPLEGSIRASKAAYTRVEDDRLYGRLCRLLVRPLILAVAEQHHHPLVSYLQAFRYPLAGEIAVDAAIVDELRVPVGMGLELGTLGELYRLAGMGGTVQVDLGNHRHDHRPVTGSDGLVDVAPQVVGALAAVLKREADIDLTDITPSMYVDCADQLIEHHARDARLNGLSYDAEAERAQVERYRSAVADPPSVRWMPAWTAVDVDPATVVEAGRPPGLTTTGGDSSG